MNKFYEINQLGVVLNNDCRMATELLQQVNTYINIISIFFSKVFPLFGTKCGQCSRISCFPSWHHWLIFESTKKQSALELLSNAIISVTADIFYVNFGKFIYDQG